MVLSLYEINRTIQARVGFCIEYFMGDMYCLDESLELREIDRQMDVDVSTFQEEERRRKR